jgi:hypothetical protein
MSMINRENYEIYIIDFLEGKLAAHLEIELQQFLGNNPDLQLEFDSLNLIDREVFVATEVDKEDFSFLKKSEETAWLETSMIAAVEGDLSEKELAELNQVISLDSKLVGDFKLFQMTKLISEIIVFENKAILKKNAFKIIPLYYKLGSIAAVFIAFFLLGLIYFGSNLKNDLQVAQANALQQEKSFKPIIKPLIKVEKQSSNKPKSTAVAQKVKAEILPLDLHPIALKELASKKLLITKTNMEFEKVKQGYQSTFLSPVKDPLASLGSDQNYLKPSQWLFEKTKQMLRGKQSNTNDSMYQGNVGLVALNLLQKTTGIAYHDKKDEETGTKSFGIVSRFFAYERITHY